MTTWIDELEKTAKLSKVAKMIPAATVEKALKTKDEAKRIAKSEMPSGEFVFQGMDEKYVYFRVASKKATKNEIRDIKEKTRFEAIVERESPIYVGDFRIRIM